MPLKTCIKPFTEHHRSERGVGHAMPEKNVTISDRCSIHSQNQAQKKPGTCRYMIEYCCVGEGCLRDVFIDEATLLLPVPSDTLRHPSMNAALRPGIRDCMHLLGRSEIES